jgi:hypothetical protein
MNMNFEGRYYTENGLLVAVHPSNDREGKWHGHEIVDCVKKQQPLEYDLMIELWWNEFGDCVKVNNTRESLNNFDLKKRVSGIDCREAKMRVKGCKECERG